VGPGGATTTVHRDRVPALDGLRGAAVVAVLLFHADHLTGGFLGVDLFFVLSGYLITTLLLDERMGTGGVALGHFWSRRARRLLPALLAMLIGVGLWARSGVTPSAKGAFQLDALATITYVANWRQIFGSTGYFSAFADASPLRHTWSLAIEEQFYVFWPLVVLALTGRTKGVEPGRRVFLLAAGGAVLSGGGMIVASLLGVGTERLYLGTDTRIAAIFLGAAFASYRAWKGVDLTHRGRQALSMAAAAALALLGMAWLLLDGQSTWVYRGGLLACSVAATVVIADVTTPGPTVVRTAFELTPLRWMGLISYGLYLWHWPMYLILTPARTGWDGWSLTLLRISVSVAIAVMSYFIVEQPVRTGRLPTALAAPATAVGLALVLLAVTLGSAGAVSDKDPGHQDGEALNAGATRVLVVGDSVAHYLAQEGMIPDRGKLGIAVTDESFVGCSLMAPIGTVYNPGGQREAFAHGCQPAWKRGVTEARPDVVVVLFGGFAYDEVLLGGRRRNACDPDFQKAYRAQLDTVLRTVGTSGARVALVSAPPAVTPRITQIVGADQIERRTACMNALLRSSAADAPHVAFVDLAGWACPKGDCRDELDGVTLREDGIHFRHDGAKVAAAWLVPQLTKPTD